MSAFPNRDDLFTGTPSPALAKTWFGALFDAITELLGTDGTAQTAREGLNIAVKNWLHNPDGAVYQRALTTVADDNYADDRWYALTQSGAVAPSQVSNPEDGYRYALRLTQSQASAQRMGRAQIIEGKDAVQLRGKTVTFGGRVKLSTTANLRMAILTWSGTEDSVTSDVVADWTNTSYTAGNFFNTTSLTAVASSSTALVAGTAADASVSGAIPSNANNIIVFYWTEGTVAQNVTLDGWGLRLIEASSLLDYIRVDAASERTRCKQFYRTSYEGQVAGTTTATAGRLLALSSSSSAYVQFVESFGEDMRAQPSVTFYNPSTGLTTSPIRNETGGTNFNLGGVSATDYISRRGFAVQASSAPPASQTMSLHYTASADL